METRYYQEEAKAAFFEDYEQNPTGGSGLIYAATGAGKTVIGADIGKSLNQPLLFLVHRDELAEQTISKFLAVWKGVDIGLVKAKHNQLGATVTVASIQTLATEKRLEQVLNAKKYSLVIQDECFPAGTLVDGKPIEQIRVGDYVDSFNHNTYKIEKKRVDQVMKKPCPDEVTWIMTQKQRTLVMTHNHPVYSLEASSYVLAESLKQDDDIMCRKGRDTVFINRKLKNVGTHTYDYVYNISVEDNHNYFANGILVHNCHHAPSPTWERVLKSIPAYRLGLTATPVRADEVALDGLFSKVLYKYSVIDGIKDGYLVDIQGRQIDINMSLDGVKCRAGDFNAMALADVMTNPQVMDVVYAKWNEYASSLKTVAFCCDVNHAKLSAEYFSLRGVNAEWIAGSMDYDTRKAVLRRFSRGQTQVLFNCMILTEGWDEPSIECVMMLRPTSSESLYIQQLGRGLRLYPGKQFCLVLDFIGATQKHKLMQFGDLTGVPYPKVAKVKPTGEPMEKYLPSVRDVLVSEDKAIEVYKNQARVFNWVKSGDKLALQIGFNHYLVVRPGAESGYEAVNCHLVAWQYQEKVIYKASTVDICLSVAEEQAENLAKKKDALSFQQADREFGQRVTQKQAEMLTKYKQPVPSTAKEAAGMIGKLFFDTFQRKANDIASPELRNMIKAQQYQGMLGCKISLEQIDKLKQIEAEKIQKFYLNGGGFKKWR